jgi:multidrug efflux pump
MTSQSSLGSTRITLQFGLTATSTAPRATCRRRSTPRAPTCRPACAAIRPTARSTRRRADPDPGADLGHADARPDLRRRLHRAGSRSCRRSKASARSSVSGSALPAVRVELNPQALFKYGIGLEDVRAALASPTPTAPRAASSRRPALQIYTNDQANKAADYKPLIVAYRNGAAVRLSDVGEVTTAVEDLRNSASPTASRRCWSSSTASPAPTSSTPSTA